LRPFCPITFYYCIIWSMSISDSGHADHRFWPCRSLGQEGLGSWINSIQSAILWGHQPQEEAMTQASLSMRKIEEILRLKFAVGLSHRAIAQSCRVSASTVSTYVAYAKGVGLSWPLPEGMTGEELEKKLSPGKGNARQRKFVQPDWRHWVPAVTPMQKHTGPRVYPTGSGCTDEPSRFWEACRNS